MKLWRSALPAALLLTACATDVVLKPAVATFNGQAREATAAVDKSYGDLAASFNEVTAGWLADNPQCGFRTTLRLRTAAADAWLAQHGSTAPATASTPPGACLSDDEWSRLEDGGQKGLADIEKLTILSRGDFAAQTAAIDAIGSYVATLADAADAPAATLSADIGASADALRALGGSLVALRQLGAKDKPGDTLFADGGPVASFAGGIADLAGSLETIVKQGRDAAAIRAAVLGPQGTAIEGQLQAIAADADRWTCVQFNVARLGAVLDERRQRGRLAQLDRPQRLEAYRRFLASRAAMAPQACGSGGIGAPPSATGRMLAELAKAHADLRRIASGQYNAREKRLMANATLTRLAAVLQAIAKTAAVVI